MNDWHNDPPEHPEPPEWYALIEEAIGNDPPPAISTAIRKLIDDWTEEQNRMQGEPDVPDIYDHQALACGVCGSATWSLLRSGKIECAGCQEVRGNKSWTRVAEDAVQPGQLGGHGGHKSAIVFVSISPMSIAQNAHVPHVPRWGIKKNHVPHT